MSCPNALPGLDGNCNGRRWIMHRDQPIPCPSCWRAAGRRPLDPRQTAALRRFHVVLTIAAYNDALQGLDRAGVDTALRDAWLAWVEREGAPKIEVRA